MRIRPVMRCARTLTIFLIGAAALLSFVCTARADVLFPIVREIVPAALQVGTTETFEAMADNNLYGAWEVLVAGAGVSSEVDVPPPLKASEKPASPGRLKFRLKATRDALPGLREVRLVTPQGPSTLGNITVVRDPVVRESPKPHRSIDQAQPVPLPVAVCGSIHTTEDVDCYRFTVAAGKALNFHVTGQRLQVRTNSTFYFNPLLTLRNSKGTVLAVSTITFGADPLLHYRFDNPGDYFLEVRDNSYRGNHAWQYCVEINDRPFVTHADPVRLMPGSTARLRLFGHNLPTDPVISYSVPAEMSDGLHWLALPLDGGQESNLVPFEISRLPDVSERAGDKSMPDKAQPITVPCGITGRIETEGEVDGYAFDAVKGQRYTFHVSARDCQSPLDSHVVIRNARGDKLIENDDFLDRIRSYNDSRIENWTAPDTGRYIIEIKDAQLRGGPDFTYFLRALKAEPHFELTLDTDKTILSPGTASVVYARVTRKDGFEGEVDLHVEGLPPGVTATCGRILAASPTAIASPRLPQGGIDGCIILQAAPNANRGAANIRVTGTVTLPARDGKPAHTLTATAVPLQEIHMGGGGRHHAYVSNHVVAVCGPLDLKAIQLSTHSVTLKPGGSQRIDVTLVRAEEFKSNVTLAVLYQHLGQIFGNSLPEGVKVDDKNSFLLLTGTTTKGHITLRADAKAKPVKDQIVPVMAHVAVSFALKTTYCAEPLRITVTAP